MKQANTTVTETEREEAIQIVGNHIGHTNGRRWLRESTLSTEEIYTLYNRFSNEHGALFRSIEVFTPLEVLSLKKEVIIAFAQAGLEVKKPNFALKLSLPELKLLWEKLNRSYLHKFENRIGNALIVHCVGTPVERERVKVALGRSTHPEWLEALKRTETSANHYLAL
ncbi:hypothetical protein [Vibrio parahaemolyticus]|uniref:hypothetical protein n=1 Tax=Vibrio parahaemolyticus TaxID=670 RepID=UPI000813504F|nr:hypothetical protein [Vibrio parahaemolyticus]OCP68465.1 hypothetical protein AKH08_16785 [Vibrio parahaemolyticus]